MRTLEIKEPELMRIALQDEIERSEESRYDHRLHGVLLVCSGLSCYHVAELLGQSPGMVQYWVQRFDKSGFAGLQKGERPGRPTIFDEATLQRVGNDLRQQPKVFGCIQNLWDGKLLSYHLSQQYGIKIGVRQCQRLFGKMGFRRRKTTTAHCEV
jgi:transposase